MTSAAPKVFVTTATGRQGAPLAHKLRKLGWSVSATARDLKTPVAEALASAGVKLVEGDWGNTEALSRAMVGCEKLFLCPVTSMSGDPEEELRQARTILEIAKASGVNQVVASTTLGVSTQGRTEHSDLFVAINTIKEAVEKAVQEAGFDSWTILRPAVFMSNFLLPLVDFIFPQLRQDGIFKTAMSAESKMALVDQTNIADIAAAVLQEPHRFNGQAVGVASDMISIPQLLEQLSKVSARTPLRPYYMSEEEIDAEKSSMSFMHSERSLRLMDEYLDMEQLSGLATLTTFEEWLDEHKDEVKATYA